jgi:hypothetical protein
MVQIRGLKELPHTRGWRDHDESRPTQMAMVVAKEGVRCQSGRNDLDQDQAPE